MTKKSEEELYLEILKAEGIETEISYLEYIARSIRNIPHWLEVAKGRFFLKV